jgi:hypothetical protein
MFRASLCPSSGATTAVAASGLPSERGGSSAVGRDRADRPAGPTTGHYDARIHIHHTCLAVKSQRQLLN